MSILDSPAPQQPKVGLPVELINVSLFGLGILAVVMIGAFVSERIASDSPWLFAAAYGVPAIIAFAIYWLIARRLKP